MWQKLFQTGNGKDLLILRLALGVMIFPHGAQKLLGWFGGYGYAGTMGYFTQNLGIPYPLALLVIVAEFFGGLALIAGVLTRLSALGVGVTLFVGALMSHVQYGFFMNWSGQKAGEGYEFHILAVAIAAVLVFRGSGRWGVDTFIHQKLKV